MKFKLFIALISASIVVAISMPALSDSNQLGVIGKMIAVERIDEKECDELDDDGKCAYEAIERGLEKLQDYMLHFRCMNASRYTSVFLDPNYEPYTKHDPGPVVKIQIEDLRCTINPKSELLLVSEDEIPEQCSMLNWKCNVIWVPDEDQTLAYIGRLPR